MITILILPGWRLPASRYEKLVKALGVHRYDVRAIDLPGFGVTKLEEVYSLDTYVDYLHTYIQREKLKSVILFGHSFGGRLSIRFTSVYPQYVKKMILTGVPGFPPVPKGKVLFFFVISKIGKILFLIPGISKTKQFAKKLLYRLSGSVDYNKTDGFIRETFRSVIAQKLVDDMKQVQVPVLLLWGDNDTIVPISVAKRMKDTFTTSKLKILSDTHALPYSQPDQCAKIVHEFIAS